MTGNDSEAPGPEVQPAQVEGEKPTAAAEGKEAAVKADVKPSPAKAKGGNRKGGSKRRGKPGPRLDVGAELRQLMDLALRHPEIAPPLASLAFKVGDREVGQRLTRLGQQGDQGVEFFFIASQADRRDGRFDEALQGAINAIASVASRLDSVDESELRRLLHLVRHGFAVALFELKDVQRGAELAAAYVELAPRIEARFGKDHFFRTLLAQSLW